MWEKLDEKREPNQERCRQGQHTWIASFFRSGGLAYWECADCGARDREIERLPERLDTISGWIESPPRLIARGPHPPSSARKWVTPDGALLTEGDPSSIHFIGEVIPCLAEAHTYVQYDESGQIVEVYAPLRQQPWEYTDHCWLIRYQVIGTELVQFESHCFEDSTYEIPNAGEPKRQVILSGLRLLPNETSDYP